MENNNFEQDLKKFEGENPLKKEYDNEIMTNEFKSANNVATINVLANDQNTQYCTVKIKTNPSYGKVSVNSNKTIRYELLKFGYTYDSFQYSLYRNENGKDTEKSYATVKINLNLPVVKANDDTFNMTVKL